MGGKIGGRVFVLFARVAAVDIQPAIGDGAAKAGDRLGQRRNPLGRLICARFSGRRGFVGRFLFSRALRPLAATCRISNRASALRSGRRRCMACP